MTPVFTEPAKAVVPVSIEAAYVHCERITKREAKNFYYAFRVLPKHKRSAMCAIYAFMRRADDIADDEAISIEQRRLVMSDWLTCWRASTLHDSDPVFVAVRDTQARFSIPNELLEQLVQGTTLDLDESQPGTVNVSETTISHSGRETQRFQMYERFDDLYRYCYLVASVVGLVCIRIFGYTDVRAELLAEKTGIAFQLTNILRDVKEDAERGRIYLPLEDLERTGLEVEHLALTASGAMKARTAMPLLKLEEARAREFYLAADELIPLVDRDSRAALWVLVTIYRNLLGQIAQADYDVFSRRASVPASTKLFILLQGAAMSLRNRVFA